MTGFILEIPSDRPAGKIVDLFAVSPEISMHHQSHSCEFTAWGDPIARADFRGRLDRDCSPEFIVNNLYGHFYYIFLDKKSGELTVGNSLFSILPIFYCSNSKRIILSDNALTLGRYSGSDKICRRFVLETLLFNYPLFNSSIHEDIHLLPSNSSISVSAGKLSVRKHTSIAGLIDSDPAPWRDGIRPITDLFLETVEKYLPPEHYSCSLTGGFDGRTLAAAGLYHKRNFSAYSFGTSESKDIIIAEEASSRAGIPFNRILLGEEYITQHSLRCGREYMTNSSGTATFARAHYLYAAKQLSDLSPVMITGNFGSEIFRAAHIAGVVISKHLYTLFSSDSSSEAIRSLEAGEEFGFLNKESFREEWESLKEDIQTLPCFNNEYAHLTRNQRFYLFVFEELFRKYFGAEMTNQFRYLRNRTPYLDIDFLRGLLKSGLAGIHSEFFEFNPVKRFKGQVLYSHIIRKAYPALGQIITDKGYRPDDLLSLAGKFNITKHRIRKSLGGTPSDPDPNGVEAAWQVNRDHWNSVSLPAEYFGRSSVEQAGRELRFKIISLSYLISKVTGQAIDS